MWQLFVLVFVVFTLIVSAVVVVRDWREGGRRQQNHSHVPRQSGR